MASTNVKYTVLTNYVNAPTERNFNKIATVFIDDINMIVYSILTVTNITYSEMT